MKTTLKKKSRWRYLLPVTGLIAASLVAAFFYFRSAKPQTTMTVPVGRGDVETTVLASGTVESDNLVSVGAQVTSDTAATDATLAITVNGEALAGTTMAQTITAAADVGQLATTALLTVPCGASVTVGLANTGDTEITVNEASFVLTRVA